MNNDEFRIALMANPHMDFRHKVYPEKCPQFIEDNKISLLLHLYKRIKSDQSTKEIRHNDKLISELNKLVTLFITNNIEYVFIKWSMLPRSQNDLDILIFNDIDKVSSILEKSGYKLDSITPYRYTFIKEGVEVDIHTDTAWTGVIYFNKFLVFYTRETRTFVDYNNNFTPFTVYVPSSACELLITAAHCMRENRITLYDVLSTYPLLTNENIDFASKVAKENGWLPQLQSFVNIVNEIYDRIYIKHDYKDLELPYRFPLLKSAKLKLHKFLHDLRTGNIIISPYITDLKERCRLSTTPP
ncbi:hypothetical protein DRO97_02655 [Archaeoglobales archaeon]|nr:MAG: hypothetical protein DRO97_02655 [Archaeoglobales archaeon]